MIDKYTMSYDMNKIIFVKVFTMKCHTCRDEMRIMEFEWLHPYLSYDWNQANQNPPSQILDSRERLLWTKKNPM